MRKIVYLLIWAGIFGMTACDDTQVGYLATDNAAYQKDSLYLYNIQDRLEELTILEEQFKAQAGPLMEERDEWQKKADAKQQELWDFDDYVIDPVEDALAETTDPTEQAALQKQLDELLIQREEIRKEKDSFSDKVWYLRREIEQIAVDMGIGSEKELKNNISKLKNTIEYKIPWVTSPMESVFGTEPLIYSIAEVKNDNPADVELFRKSLTIMGGGRMYVDQNVEASPGRYIISIQVTNEGHTTVLNDVFTFVIEEGESIED